MQKVPPNFEASVLTPGQEKVNPLWQQMGGVDTTPVTNVYFKQKGKKEGVETANRIIKAMVKREVIMEKRAMLAAGGKKAKKEKVEKLLLSKRDDGSYVFQMTYDRMASEFKLTKQEVDIIRNLDRGLAEARIYHNRSVKENPEVGATIIPERPNYFPRVWNGRHRIYIKEPGKEGQMIHAIAGKTEKEVYGIYDTFIKTNPQYKNQSPPFYKNFVYY